MDKLSKLLERCKCSVTVSVNDHKDLYVDAKEYLKDCQQISDTVRLEMIRQNKVVNITFYPDTPIGLFDIYHYDLDLALSQALECLGLE